MKRRVYAPRTHCATTECDSGDLVVVGSADSAAVVSAGFLSAAMRLGKVEGADKVRKLNRRERRALAKRRRT